MQYWKTIPTLLAFVFIMYVILLVTAPKGELVPGTNFTYDEVFETYNKILLNSGYSDRPQLIILDSNVIDARTDGKIVTMTTGMLKIFNNTDEMALIFGHEFAHYIAKDPYHDDMKDPDMEANADKLGAFIMMRAGFNLNKGREIMVTFKKLLGDFATPTDHPSNSYRFDQLDLPQCHGLFNW